MAKQSKRTAATRRRQETVRANVAVRKEEPKVEAVDFKVEYHYVLADLKRFAVLAVAMIALLVVLALVL